MSQHSRRVGRRSHVVRLLQPRRWVMASLCAAVALVWALVGVGQAHATPTRSASSGAQQAVELDSPAVVRIVSVINASLTCTACASDGSDIHSPADGSTFTYYSSGSGAFISPNGAILTADHVVDHSMSNAEDVGFVEQQASQDIATRYNDTAAQALTYLQNNPSKVTITFQIVFQKAFLSTAYTGNLPDTKHIYAFTIASIAASSPADKQDTAIARIDTRGISPAPDFPYLQLFQGQVNPLDNVTAIAFPADADLALNSADFTALGDVGASDVNTINSLLSPSVNTGTITKTNEISSYGPVYEATSIASNGSSGGPVINNQGQVIGFVDAGTPSDRLTFIVPSSVALKYATQAGIANSGSGRFMSMWSQAFGEYNSSATCHWTTAAKDLTTLKREYPTFGGVTPYLTQAKQSAASEACAATASTGGASTTTITGDVVAGFWLIGGCAGAVIALMLGVIFLAVALTRRSKRRKPAKVAAPVAVPVAAPHAPYPPGQAPYAPTAYAPGAAPPALHAPGTRLCQNGHVVTEADAAFCPICGTPVQSAPGRG